jgi:Ca2+-binding RTX toxin-like protein
MRAPVTALAALLCLLVLAPAAVAGTLSKVGTTYVYAAPGAEVNDLSVVDTGANLSFDEALAGVPVTLAPSASGCSGGGTAAAVCPDAGITAVVVDLTGGDDTLTPDSSVTIPVQADGGLGDDTLRGGGAADELDGGAGRDLLAGGNGADQLLGAADNDAFGVEDGGDVVSGGTGWDTLYIEGGWPTPVPFSLNDVADDGLAPFFDLRSDVEEITAEIFNDDTATLPLVLTGSAGPNALRGGLGEDVIDGRAGSDILSGSDGDDEIRARDGEADRVSCGAGTDSATVDVADVVDECETVDRAAAPATTTTPPPAAPAADDAAPRVAFLAPARDQLLDPRRANPIVVDASDDRGVDRVVLFDDGRPVGLDATAPYAFDYRPGGDDVGRNTLVAVAYDGAGQTASDIRALRLDRFAARSLSAAVTPTRDRRAAYRFTTSGRLGLPAAVSRAAGCAGGEVAVVIKRGARTVSSRRAALRRDCTFRSTVRFTSRRRLGSGRLRVLTRFLGNDVLRPSSAPTRSMRAG